MSSEPSPHLHGDPPAAAGDIAHADRNSLAAIAVERTRMPMVVTDPRRPDNPIVLANKAFLELTGYTADETIGQNCRFLQGEGTAPAAIHAIREALHEEKDFEIEILNYRKDGSAFWNQLSLRPVHDDEGRLLYVFASQIDVTEFRKVQSLEASEHRLLKEVDHRARNVLAVVGGIVRLTRSENAAHYATAIQQRVQVLAEAHSLLADRGWQELPLQQVIERRIGSAPVERISAGGPEILISAQIVQPVSLVLHELADNAHAHGALSVPAGRVEVTWEATDGYGGFLLHWREIGGPAYPSDPHVGFGTTMVAGMIERQLRGHVERAWVDGGLVIHLTVPAAVEPPKL